VLGCALKYLGFSYNSTNTDELKKVEDLLIAQKKNIKVFADDNGQDLLASGEVVMCQEWNGDIVQVMAEDEDLGYAVPTEGSLVWQDTMAIPAGAPHPENAHAFLNYILDGEAGKHIAATIQYATANEAARNLMDDAYKSNPAIFPPDEIIAKCESAAYLGEEATKVRDETWTRIQAA
ncbi:MAG: spermidine/putrescine ABC transporter substrate-binding protein, partial [Alphaproteobacteria bacterium]|nr:spermidine/putrescine ABC transporter substrate-binding protein [Alphaproteobacteria bacterium]